MNNYVEKPEAVFTYVPEIRTICIEFGIDFNDAKTITAMYETFKRAAGNEIIGRSNDVYEEGYDDGYKEGYNDAIDEAIAKLEDASWEIDRLKK